MQALRSLGEDEKRMLLRFARSVAERRLGGASGDKASAARPTIPGRFGGAFVTFYHDQRLRGCVGTFAPTEDIAATVEHVTIASLGDSRFESDPVHADELALLDMEISILSDLIPAPDPLSLKVGEHGIKIELGIRSGCFLPKVAVERNWSAEQFLSYCCAMKAGLPPNAWRNPQCQVSLFTADAFRESELLSKDSACRTPGTRP